MTGSHEFPFVEARATRERSVLTILFISVYVAYAALGHDIVLNKANCQICFAHDSLADVHAYDPIGYLLPYARVFACSAAIFVIWAKSGVGPLAGRAPLLFAPFVALALASSAWADSPKDVFRDAATLTALWAALPLLIHRLGPAATVRLSLHLMAAVVISSCFLAIAVPTIGRHTGNEIVQAVHAGRWRGIFGHKNGLGAWAAYGSVFLFTHSWMAGGPRLYWRFAGICAVACLILSGSSTGLTMAAALWYVRGYFQFARRLGFWSASLLFLLATVALVGAAAYFIDDILDWIGRDATLTGRTLLWELILDHFAQSPLIVQLLGSGYQSAGGWEFALMLEGRFGQPMTPEDSYFSLLLGLGIFGCAGFFVPYFASIRNGLGWLEHVSGEDRAALEFFLMTLVVALVASFTEATALLPTAYDGILSFGSLFALLVTPRAPTGAPQSEGSVAKRGASALSGWRGRAGSATLRRSMGPVRWAPRRRARAAKPA